MPRQNAKPVLKNLFKLGITKEELAVKLQVSVSAIERWSKAERKPSNLAYDKLLQIYSILKKQAKKNQKEL